MALFPVLALLFLFLALLVATGVSGGVATADTTRAGFDRGAGTASSFTGFIVLFELAIQILLASGDFVDALFGGLLGHAGEFGVVFATIGDFLTDGLLRGEI